MPLVELRKAARQAKPGDIIEMRGDHPASKGEVQLAAKSLNMKVLSVSDDGTVWTIRVQR